MSSGMLPTLPVKVHMVVNKMTGIYMKSQVLTVVNTETTEFLGVMWHHHFAEPVASFLLYTSFPCLSSSCFIIFLPVKKKQLHYVLMFPSGFLMEVLYIMYHFPPICHTHTP